MTTTSAVNPSTVMKDSEVEALLPAPQRSWNATSSPRGSPSWSKPIEEAPHVFVSHAGGLKPWYRRIVAGGVDHDWGEPENIVGTGLTRRGRRAKMGGLLITPYGYKRRVVRPPIKPNRYMGRAFDMGNVNAYQAFKKVLET